ncbi:hypothetical protein [Campylobacter sp. RM16187]|uniref:hypothetical protein n=1 Tax=Campylobacter sp. RM16187 TaxID=1660063 RepID=UPI0021B5558E|nr:hypothetical protein [Campylobacter sp. RM16187]QKG30251.1 hypothetical protein CDOMF_a002 [Campylobacter sp. RM16187]
MRYFIFACIFSSFAFAKCYYIPCDGNVNATEQQTKMALKPEFENVISELKILKEKYETNLKTYEKSNQLLSDQIALAKEKALRNKEIIFLLTKFNQSLSTSINIDAITDEVSKNAN